MSEDSQNESPNGAGLLVLGMLSLLLGPLTAIPGLLISKRFRPFSPSAAVGYVLCWIFLAVTVLSVLFFALRFGRAA